MKQIVEVGYGATGGYYAAASSSKGTTLYAQMDLMAERLNQKAEFGIEADDALLPSEWIARIVKHVGRAVALDPATFRQEMVVVGALTLAALEAFDRRYVDE